MDIKLKKKEVEYLQEFKRSGNHTLREFNRAMVLLFLNKEMTITEIENLLEVDRTTIWRIKKKYQEQGVEKTLLDEPRSGQPKKYTSVHEAELTALACGPAPKGRKRWTIRLLVEELRKKKGLETVTYRTVYTMLKKTNLSLG